MKINTYQNQIKKHKCEWETCTLCPIGQLARKHVLFKAVNEAQKLDVLFIGESPGYQEDREGLPFVGKAGMLLDDLIKEAEPGDLNYGFTNLVACRPADRLGAPNREPLTGEILKCSERLKDFIRITQPKVIVLVGALARESGGYSARDANFNGYITNIVHPAYLLRIGCNKEKMLITVQKIRDAFSEARYIINEDTNRAKS